MRVDAEYNKDIGGDWHDIPADFHLTYSWIAIDPDESGYKDESANVNIVSDSPYEHHGHGFILDLTDATGPLSFERTESVTEEQERSVTMTHATELDVGVSSETTVGGSFAGVSVEEKISASFGYKSTSEESKAQSESKSKTVEVKIAYEGEPGTSTLLTVESNDIHALTPFSWNGSVNYGIKLTAWKDILDGAPWGEYMKKSKRAKIVDDKYGWGEVWQIVWHDWDDFLSFWDGTNTDFPESVDKTLPKAAKPYREALGDPALRYINLSGTEHRHYQDGAEMKVVDVTGQDLDTVAAAHGVQIVMG